MQSSKQVTPDGRLTLGANEDRRQTGRHQRRRIQSCGRERPPRRAQSRGAVVGVQERRVAGHATQVMGPVESTRTRGETMATVEVGEQQLLIGESWRGASSGATYEKTNPYTGGSAGRAAAAMRENARAAVDAAAEAFPALKRGRSDSLGLKGQQKERLGHAGSMV
jgi:hypothetical protein